MDWADRKMFKCRKCKEEISYYEKREVNVIDDEVDLCEECYCLFMSAIKKTKEDFF